MNFSFSIYVVCAVLLTPLRALAAPLESPKCVSSTLNGPIWVTPHCVDAEYSSVIVNSETDEEYPIPHRKVSAHFNGSITIINIYLPSKLAWRGRFFHSVYPTQGPNASDEDISFAASSGAYWVQITGTLGYRADAAAAKFSRILASQYYNVTCHHIYGYIFGGSGGSFQVIGAMENTIGIWDGAVPYVQAVPASNPPNFCIRALAGLVLKEKSGHVIDALRPGGSGDPYASLDTLEKGVLHEASSMGIPLASWQDFETVASTSSLVLLNQTFQELDPNYRDDFWTLPGYLGTESSALGEYFRSRLIDWTTTISRVSHGPDGSVVIFLNDLPFISSPIGLDFTIYNTSGTKLGVVWGSLNVPTKEIRLYDASNATAVDAIIAGLKVVVDNKNFLAMHAYHRHQLPSYDDFHTFDQFRSDTGYSLYPQRNSIMGEVLSAGTCGGCIHSGNITGKVIVVDNLMDGDAFAWHAHWYRNRVQKALGVAFDNNYRLWYNEHANHEYGPMQDYQKSMLVPYKGMVQFALQELAQWVETGDLPPDSTGYTVTDFQISVAEKAGERRGIQPVVNLTANNLTLTTIHLGDAVAFRGRAEVPPGTSKITAVEWDFLGDGQFISSPLRSPSQSIDITLQRYYNATGTFIPGVRITSQREGDSLSRFARAMNLGHARVVVV